MRNKELIKWNKLWNLKSQILSNCLQRKYGAQLGEVTKFVVFGFKGLKVFSSIGEKNFTQRNILLKWYYFYDTFYTNIDIVFHFCIETLIQKICFLTELRPHECKAFKLYLFIKMKNWIKIHAREKHYIQYLLKY